MATKKEYKQKIMKFINEAGGSFSRNDAMQFTGETYAHVASVCNELIAAGALEIKKSGNSIKYVKTGENATGSMPNAHHIPVLDRFRFIEKFTKMVAGGISPSFLLTGQAGVGKTYTILNVLRDCCMEEGEDFIVVKGHSSPMGLYKTMYYHRSKIIVFDDCDSIWKDASSVNLLKAGLDSYNKRIISWNSVAAERGDMEPEFEFEGQIVFISNVDAEKLDPAVVNRTITANLDMTNDEILDRIESIMDRLNPEIAIDKKLEVMSFLREKKDTFESLSIRTFLQASRIREAEDVDWKDMILYTV